MGITKEEYYDIRLKYAKIEDKAEIIGDKMPTMDELLSMMEDFNVLASDAIRIISREYEAPVE